jgi:23S rRNA pseudouridine1911/1915/1917 synthase
MTPEGFDLLYEEGPCLVVSKPGGVLTQGPPGIDSLELRVKQFLKQRDGKNGQVYLGVPHRLDRPVSGALILCKHVRAARRVADQFQRREVAKTYWALVKGPVLPESGTWNDFVRKIPDVAKAELINADHPEARQAVLHYRRLTASSDHSLLEIQLETGRMHQIRLQAAVRGHPILGDYLYGGQMPFGPESDDPRCRWIALHALSLRFRHPMTREIVMVRAPFPQPWWNGYIYRNSVVESVFGG